VARLLCLIALAWGLAGFGLWVAGPEPDTGARAPMTWHRGALGDPGSLDPHQATTLIEGHVLAELYEGLVTRDAGGRLIPGVASRWTVSDDETLYTFTLRPDARWSNGDPVTAHDFVFAFRRLMAPATGAPYANILYTLKNAEKINKGALPVETLGVRAQGDHRLEIALEHATPYFISQLAHITAKPLHKASVEAHGSRFTRPGNLVGNGAFVLASYVPNDRLVLVRNPYFHAAATVALDREIFYPLEDRSAALRRFMAGEIDSYDDVPLDQIAFVRARLPESLVVSPVLGAYYYAVDTRRKPLDDKRVRRALSMVIDREFLAERIWGGTMVPLYSFVPPGIDSYGEPTAVPWKDMRPFEREDAARRLLREAGYGEGLRPLEIEIRFNTSENHRATAVAIADMWKQLGIATRLRATDATTHYALLREKAPFDVARAGWFADFPDAENFLFLGESDNQGLNTPSFSDPGFDALLRAARIARSPDRRRAILHAAEARLLDEQPYLVLMAYRSSHLVSPRLHGFEPNVFEAHGGRYVSIAP
jgi:peptide/nickel transport system substrate-binding protein/oligopeptide transport system substrate-binding protein